MISWPVATCATVVYKFSAQSWPPWQTTLARLELGRLYRPAKMRAETLWDAHVSSVNRTGSPPTGNQLVSPSIPPHVPSLPSSSESPGADRLELPRWSPCQAHRLVVFFVILWHFSMRSSLDSGSSKASHSTADTRYRLVVTVTMRGVCVQDIWP